MNEAVHTFQVLEDDSDLAMMNLTRMQQSPEDYLPPMATEVLEDHEEMELLLEAYLQVGHFSSVVSFSDFRVERASVLVCRMRALRSRCARYEGAREDLCCSPNYCKNQTYSCFYMYVFRVNWKVNIWQWPC